MKSRSWQVISTAASDARRNSSSHRIDSMSRWFVGSSSSSTSGLPISTLAIDTRMRQPPESAPTSPSIWSSWKPSPCSTFLRARLELVTAELLVLALHLAEALEDRVQLVGALGIAHRLLELGELVVQVTQPPAARDRLVDHAAPAHRPRPGGSSRSRRASAPDDAVVGLLLANDQAEERRLARAVGADESDLVAGVELEARFDEQEAAAVVLRDVVEDDHEAEEGTRSWLNARAGRGAGAARW
jgi:hypothetical protein